MGKEEYYDRDKLYKEVWAEPMTKVSKKYGVSDVALAKTCKKLNIPRPPVGYWTKKEFGKEPPRPPLPDFPNPPRVFMTGSFKNELAKVRLVPEAFEEAEVEIEKEKLAYNAVIVPSTLPKELHPFVQATRDVLVKGSDRRNKYRPWNDSGRIKIQRAGLFNVNIGPESVDRVCTILQSLCVAFDFRGWTMKPSSNGITVLCRGVDFEFSIFEPSKKTSIPKKSKDDYYQPDYEFIPTGKLQLEITRPYSWRMTYRKKWSDGVRESLEGKLGDFLRGMIIITAWEKEDQAKAEVERLKREKQQREVNELKRLQRIEDQRIDNLLRLSNEYQKFSKLKTFIDAAERRYISEHGDPQWDFAEWMNWARDYLSEIDPLKMMPKYNIPDPEDTTRYRV